MKNFVSFWCQHLQHFRVKCCLLITDMLVKTYDIKDVDLIKSAEQLINSSPAQQNAECFIPYIDDTTNEIKYLHFVLSGEQWVCTTSQRENI